MLCSCYCHVTYYLHDQKNLWHPDVAGDHAVYQNFRNVKMSFGTYLNLLWRYKEKYKTESGCYVEQPLRHNREFNAFTVQEIKKHEKAQY